MSKIIIKWDVVSTVLVWLLFSLGGFLVASILNNEEEGSTYATPISFGHGEFVLRGTDTLTLEHFCPTDSVSQIYLVDDKK